MAFDTPVRYAIVDGVSSASRRRASTWCSRPSRRTALEGVEWEVSEIDDGKGSIGKPVKRSDAEPLLSRRRRGGGQQRLQPVQGAYTRDGERLTIGQAAATRRACPGIGIMEQEQAFLSALATTATWTLRGEALDLMTADGKRAVTAVRPAQ